MPSASAMSPSSITDTKPLPPRIGFVGLTVTPGDDSLDALQRNLRERGYRVLDLTDNETAKLHLRHMIGGRQPDDIGEESFFAWNFLSVRAVCSSF